VIAALSLGTAPNATNPPTAAPFPFPNFNPNSPLSAVDTLLGLSADLWPIIHRLSHLLPQKFALEAAVAAGESLKATVLRTELESTSQAIEFALANWKPTLSPEDVVGSLKEGSNVWEEIRMRSILHNASAYRHSAFVYLYRTIRCLPRFYPSVQKHAHVSLLACSNVVNLAQQCGDGPMSALLWPLFTAACEAVTDEDRELAANAFRGTERRQGMNNIARAWEIVQEVWNRADHAELAGSSEVSWREICDGMGYNIVFG